MRPKSLAEVAMLTVNGSSFDLNFANFLDEFYFRPNADALLPEPPLLAPHNENIGAIQDAYLAAAAEELARKFDLPWPTWSNRDERKLHRPWFASQLASLRAVLILESPPGFRSRNLFVSENALTRV